MTWFWNYLIFFLVLIAISLGIGYAIAEGIIGHEAAQRNVRSFLPLTLFLLFIFAIACLSPWFAIYGSVSFQILSVVVTSSVLISWSFQKQKAGVLLLDMGITEQNKLVLWSGLFQVAVASFMTWLSFDQVSRELSQYSGLGTGVANLAFWWSLAILFIALGLSKLEFRENGICFMLSFMAWQRVKSYNWEPLKPNTLTIRFKPRYPLLPGFMSMAIPAKHRDAVSHILNERLPDKNL